MPYDTLQWGESTAMNGLTGCAAKTPSPYVISGDYVVLKKGSGVPTVVGLGGTSVSKPTGCAILGNRTNGGNKFVGPASLQFPMMKDFAKQYQEGEQLTGQGSNTNTAEATIINADITYSEVHPYPGSIGAAVDKVGGGELWSVPTSCTAAASVTIAQIGTLDGLTTDTSDLWLDTRANYHIIGYVGCVGIASDCGSIIFRGLGGEWAQALPAVREHMIDPVTNDVRSFLDICYEGIPFPGDALPSYSANALSNTAVLGGLLLVKH